MAYDKVVDSAELDAGLKTVADAIREKGGTSGNLEFPAGMAAAIAAIQAGGALEDLGFVCGTFTPTEKLTPATTEVTITHGLGKQPKSFLIARTTAYPQDIWGEIGFIGAIGSGSQSLRESTGCYSSASNFRDACMMKVQSSDAQTITFKTDKYGYLNAGTTYIWLAI